MSVDKLTDDDEELPVTDELNFKFESAPGEAEETYLFGKDAKNVKSLDKLLEELSLGEGEG